MPFSSYDFILLFLPLCLITFYLIRLFSLRLGSAGGRKLIKIFLILISIVFLSFSGLRNVIILLISIVLNAVFLSILGKKKIKPVFIAGIAANILFLFLFKYGSAVTSFLYFPIAISFYTFEQIAFLTDYYKGDIPQENSGVLNYLLYILYFPKLIQGPIANFSDMSKQFDEVCEKRFDAELFLRGCLLFSIGAAKKTLLADVLGASVDAAFSSVDTLMTVDTVIIAFAYVFQLYFDFSGYCDMAEGVSLLFGIRLPENFNSPYKQTDFLSYWHNWHATLGRFFTRYVYIPLGGSKKRGLRLYLNIMIVFILSGLWHGNSPTFLLWAVINTIIAVLTKLLNLNLRLSAVSEESLTKKLFKKAISVIRTAFSFILWSIILVIFRADTIDTAFSFYKRFGLTPFRLSWLSLDVLNKMIPLELVTVLNKTPLWNTYKFTATGSLIMLGICAFIVFFCKNSHEIALKGKLSVSKVVFCSFLLVWSILSIGKVRTFLYINF